MLILSLFSLFFLYFLHCQEYRLEIIIYTIWGKVLLTYWDKIWNLEGDIFEKYFTAEVLWDVLLVFWK